MSKKRMVYASSKRIVKKMKDMLDDYQENRINLHTLVNGLEGSLNAFEEKLPEDFQTHWYIHWGGLEQVLAGDCECEHGKEINSDIEALKSLLSEL